MAVGTNGTILKTTDGGIIWNSLSSGISSTLWGIDFINKYIAVAVGDYGTILKTTDSGIKWFQQLSETNSDLRDVNFINTNIGLAVGDGIILKTTNGGFTFIGEDDNSFNPNDFSLDQNYPNPFNPTTSIGFRIAEFGFVSLKVYDILGREVATLVNEDKHAGNYEVEFNGSGLSSGIYFYKLSVSALPSQDRQAGNYVSVKKMILMK